MNQPVARVSPCFREHGTPGEAGLASPSAHRALPREQVTGAPRGKTLHFIVHNMNPQGKLYKFDMRPVRRLPALAQRLVVRAMSGIGV